MKLAYSSSFIEITVRVNTCSFSSRVSHSLMLATLNYQVGVLFCSAVTLCFLKLNTWLPIFLFFSIWSSWLWKGHSLCYQHITCEKGKCSSFVENYFTVRFCVVFMATDADGKKGGKMKFAIIFFYWNTKVGKSPCVLVSLISQACFSRARLRKCKSFFSCFHVCPCQMGPGGHSARFEYSTVDKVGSEKLLARKSCFM